MDFNTAGEVDSEHGHSLHLSTHPHQYNTPQSANGTSFATSFRHMDHSMDSGASRNIHPHPSSSPHLLAHDGNGSIQQGHVQQNYYGDPRNAIVTPSTPSQSASPRFTALSPRQNRQVYQAYVPQDRSLPERAVNDVNTDDAYAAFILYCNPTFPTTIDTTELKKVFRTPPKSDGHSFSTYTLYELLQKFESKEIKTWTELALELGVEKPAVEKGQSSQKVQQYSVRLKRWMRALHIDAFFEYLMGKSHIYFSQVPPLSDPFPESRDGVPIEEDLAVRALDPKFRPKRGRRRADDHDDDMEPSSAIDNKRPHLDTSFSGYPASAYPSTAHPDDLERFVHGDPWSAAITPASSISGRGNAAGQHLRWRNETPSTPHPMSAIEPMSAHPGFDEPQSAVTPSSRSRPKRRHGPAVSSAWPSTNTTANGKLRGRPPSNRSVRDGPYVTFPANPKTKEGPTIDLSRNHITTSTDPATSTPATSESPVPQFRVPQQPTPVSATDPHHRPLISGPQTRPERLQLQVPQHVGNPVVRLVTPTLLVNGQMNGPINEVGAQSAVSQTMTTPGLSTASTAHTTGSSFFGPPAEGSTATELDEHSDGTSPGFRRLTPKPTPVGNHLTRNTSMMQTLTFSANPFFSNEDLKRALAADLLRAEIEGRGKRLRGSEAKELAEVLLSRLRPQQHSAVSDPGGISGLASEDVFRLTSASWLGLNLQLGLSSSGVQSTGAGKKITVRRFRVGGDGYDSPLDEDDTVDAADEIRETFDVEWSLALGDCAGKFSFKGLMLRRARDVPWDQADDMMDTGPGAERGDDRWKDKVLRMEKKLREQEEEIRRLKDRVLDAIL
ncbi:hypothetical protein EJ08DRAFT_648323 [Tothia fuscella]|uniref:ARS binding protein 2 n=1 Tax=Tothia fuscella TaxID=1048955 RepID=A0A9P4NV20_9PEZI|nr:hypothetical protein EJ08DRAFT_648323 [Tothia fuscella]